MKKILLSIGALALIAVLTVTATNAFFTDTETSNVNVFTTGTLELDINGNGTGDTFTTGLGDPQLNPGGETSEAQINIKNGGTMDLAWFGYFNTGGNASMLDYVYIKEAQMEFRKIGGANWELTDKFIKDGTGNTDTGDDGHPWNSYYVNLANSNTNDGVITLAMWNADNAMGAGGGVQKGALKPQIYEYRFTFKLGMVDDVPNSLQGASMSLSYTLTSTQVTENAINALIAGNGRLLGPSDLVWFNAQLGKQN